MNTYLPTPLRKAPCSLQEDGSKNLRKALAGENIDYEVAYPQADGSMKFYDTRIMSIKGNDGEVFGIIVAVLDITEKKMLETKIVWAEPLILSVVICLINLGTLMLVGQLLVHGAS